MRISSNLITRNLLSNIAARQEKLYDLQIRMITGKRINRPSDDPVGMARVMDTRTELANLEQYGSNIDYGITWLSQTDLTLGEMENLLVRGKEIALSCSQNVWPDELSAQVSEIETIMTQILSLANTQHDDRYLFAGSGSMDAPYRMTGGNYEYCGTGDPLTLQVGEDITTPINLIGYEIFAAVPAAIRDTGVDWNPTITENTRLGDLNSGDGIPEGYIQVTDCEGNEGCIDFHGVTTVKEAIDRINNFEGLNISATIGDDGMRLVITDESAEKNNDLVIDEVDNGGTAAALGILGASGDGEIEGTDLDPALTRRTKTSQLFGGEGFHQHVIRIQNGDEVALVDLKNVADVAEIIDNITNSGIFVQAEINNQGTGIIVSSTVRHTVLTIEETENFSTARELGIKGTALPTDVLSIFSDLRTSLNRKDREGVESTLDKFDSLCDSVLNGRSEAGARINLLELSKNRNLDMQISLTELLSTTEDEDYMEVITKFTNQQVAYEAALATSAQILSNSLARFLM
jgi:flagellar hook-associated protein 3 FlgL